MAFRIVRMVLGSGGQIDISEAEFREIRAARDSISAALAAEQKFDLVIENLFEFERELLDLSLRHSFAMYRPWQAFAHERQRVNRRLGNLTFAAKLFLDQMRYDAVHLFGRGSGEQGQLESALGREERENLAHRTLMALRNRIQHQSFPEFGMTYQTGWEDDPGEEARRLHCWFDLRLPVQALEEGMGGGDRELAELCAALRGLGDEVDLLDFVRKHMEGIARVFGVFRGLIEARVAEAESLILETMERARQELGENLIGLAAVTMDGRQVTEEVQLFEEPMKYRRALKTKNHGFESISKRVVSSMSRTLAPKGSAGTR